MFQLIIPAAKAVAPYAAKVAVEVAKDVAIITALVHAIDRTQAGVQTYSGNTPLTKAVSVVAVESKLFVLSVRSAFFTAAPSAALFGTAGAIAPIKPVAAKWLRVGGWTVLAGQVAIAVAAVVQVARHERAVIAVEKELVDAAERESRAKDELRARLNPELTEYTVSDGTTTRTVVDDATNQLWDDELAQDMEVTLTTLDVAKFKRTPGKAGGDFALSLGPDTLLDDLKVSIARTLLNRALTDEASISPNKVTQALAGFDRVTKEHAA